MVTMQLSQVDSVNHQRDKSELSKPAQVCLVVNSRGLTVAAEVQNGGHRLTCPVGYIKVSGDIETWNALKMQVLYTIALAHESGGDGGRWGQALVICRQVGKTH